MYFPSPPGVENLLLIQYLPFGIRIFYLPSLAAALKMLERLRIEVDMAEGTELRTQTIGTGSGKPDQAPTARPRREQKRELVKSPSGIERWQNGRLES